MVLHEVEEAAYAWVRTGERAAAWGSGCAAVQLCSCAAVQGSGSPPLPPPPPSLQVGRLQEQALKVSCWFAPFKNDNGDFNAVIHREVFKRAS